ncbi:hypothetical protein [Streptomyces sp. G-G2]|uniref:hypothetical protein n=1 Tax=Streptomyces sp. G-G2 TaxID=3046201 RepID=UPI0024BB55F9|nr:hypothetical protein [Streptomyces sp. G-G2]MDJ0384963.1 hypothetical protein [Streptomyces sp. G-G2]
MSDDLTRRYIRKWLDANERVQEQFAQKVAEVEAAGHRLIDGGQTGSYDDAGRASWAINDWRTGAVLASGCDDYEGYSAAVAKADPDNCWILVDNLSEETGLPEVDSIPGLPDSLAEALQEWVESKAAPLEVAAWINERLEDVEPRMKNEVDAFLTT